MRNTEEFVEGQDIALNLNLSSEIETELEDSDESIILNLDLAEDLEVSDIITKEDNSLNIESLLKLDLESEDNSSDIDLKLVSDKGRYQKIISANMIYNSYVNSGAHKAAGSQVNKNIRDIFAHSVKLLNSYDFYNGTDKKAFRNDLMEKLDIANKNLKEMYSDTISKIISRNYGADELILMKASSNFDEILTRIEYPKFVITIANSDKEYIKQKLSNISSTLASIREQDRLNRATIKIIKRESTEDIFFKDAESVKIDLKDWSQEITCPTCGQIIKDNLLVFKNTYGNFFNVNIENAIMFEHNPLLCNACGTPIALSEESSKLLNSYMIQDLKDKFSTQHQTSTNIANTIVVPTEEILEKFNEFSIKDIIVRTSTDLLTSPEVLNISLKRRQVQLKSKVASDAVELERILSKNDSLKPLIGELLENNAPNLVSHNFKDLEEFYCGVLLSSSMWVTAQNNNELSIKLKEKLINVMKCESVLDDIIDKRKKRKEFELTSQINFLNSEISKIIIRKFMPLTIDNSVDVGKIYRNVLKKKIKNLESSIEHLEYFNEVILNETQLRPEVICFPQVKILNNENPIEKVKAICKDSITYSKIIALAMSNISKILWARQVYNQKIFSISLNSRLECSMRATPEQLDKACENLEIYCTELEKPLNNLYLSGRSTNLSEMMPSINLICDDYRRKDYYKFMFNCFKLKEMKQLKGTVVEEIMDNWYISCNKDIIKIFKNISEDSIITFSNCLKLLSKGFKLKEIEKVVENVTLNITIKEFDAVPRIKNQTIEEYLTEAMNSERLQSDKKVFDKKDIQLLSELIPIKDWYNFSVSETYDDIHPITRSRILNYALKVYDKGISLIRQCENLKRKDRRNYNSKLLNDLNLGKRLLRQLIDVGTVVDLSSLIAITDNEDGENDMSESQINILLAVNEGISIIKYFPEILLYIVTEEINAKAIANFTSEDNFRFGGLEGVTSLASTEFKATISALFKLYNSESRQGSIYQQLEGLDLSFEEYKNEFELILSEMEKRGEMNNALKLRRIFKEQTIC